MVDARSGTPSEPGWLVRAAQRLAVLRPSGNDGRGKVLQVRKGADKDEGSREWLCLITPIDLKVMRPDPSQAQTIA